MIEKKTTTSVDVILQYEADIPAGHTIEVLPSPSESALVVNGCCMAKITRATRFIIDEPDSLTQVVLVMDVLVSDKSQYEALPEMRKVGLTSYAFARTSVINAVMWDPVLCGGRLKLVVRNPSEHAVHFKADVEALIVR